MSETEIKFLEELLLIIQPYLPHIVFIVVFLFLFFTKARLFAYIFLIFAIMYVFDLNFGNKPQETLALKLVILILSIIALFSIKSWVKSIKQRTNIDTHKPNQNKNKDIKKDHYKEVREKGYEGENAFQLFLKQSNIPFFKIEQKSYSLFDKNTKRPDFIINFGNLIFAIEVKNKKVVRRKTSNSESYYNCYCISSDEINGLANFDDGMGIPIYFAFKNFDKWHFITLLDFIEYMFTDKEKEYIAVNRFTTIKTIDDFAEFLIKSHQANYLQND